MCCLRQATLLPLSILVYIRQILLPAITWRSCFDHFENVKVLHKCKAKGALKAPIVFHCLVSVLVGMNLIFKYGCVRNVMLTCFSKLNEICL